MKEAHPPSNNNGPVCLSERWFCLLALIPYEDAISLLPSFSVRSVSEHSSEALHSRVLSTVFLCSFIQPSLFTHSSQFCLLALNSLTLGRKSSWKAREEDGKRGAEGQSKAKSLQTRQPRSGTAQRKKAGHESFNSSECE